MNETLNTKKPIPPQSFINEYEVAYAKLAWNSRGFSIHREFRYDPGPHPSEYHDFECSFAADCLARANPVNILDIGSYRKFIIGLTAHYHVTTIDVRHRKVSNENETVITCDATNLQLPDACHEAAVCLSTIEHFGLGRYGDKIDLNADIKAITEIKRVLKPQGLLILSTGITRGSSMIAFNAHRIYTIENIHELLQGGQIVNEVYYSRTHERPCVFEEVVSEPKGWDVYCCAWRNGNR